MCNAITHIQIVCVESCVLTTRNQIMKKLCVTHNLFVLRIFFKCYAIFSHKTSIARCDAPGVIVMATLFVCIQLATTSGNAGSRRGASVGFFSLIGFGKGVAGGVSASSHITMGARKARNTKKGTKRGDRKTSCTLRHLDARGGAVFIRRRGSAARLGHCWKGGCVSDAMWCPISQEPRLGFGTVGSPYIHKVLKQHEGRH